MNSTLASTKCSNINRVLVHGGLDYRAGVKMGIRGFRDFDWPRICIEVLSIVLGVLLALAANDWNNQRLQTIKLASALNSVKSELTSNQRLLHIIHDNNEKVLAQMTLESSDESLRFTPGLQIRDSAWQAFVAADVSDVADVKLLHSLYDYYALQDVYRTVGFQTLQNIMTTTALVTGLQKRKLDQNQAFEDQISLLVMLERGLLDAMERTQATLAEYSR